MRATASACPRRHPRCSTSVSLVLAGLLLGVVLGPQLGISAIHGMAYGVVLGGALQLLWQIPSLYRAGFRFRPSIRLVASGSAADLVADGSGDSRQCRGSDQRHRNTTFASRLGTGR